MSQTEVPGLKASHQIITPVCRENRSMVGAFDEAVERVRRAYENYAASPGSEGTNWHLVLVREDP